MDWFRDMKVSMALGKRPTDEDIGRMILEIDRSREFSAKLPKTLNGVRVTLGDTVWFPFFFSYGASSGVVRGKGSRYVCVFPRLISPPAERAVHECYSTQETAEAAVEKEG